MFLGVFIVLRLRDVSRLLVFKRMFFAYEIEFELTKSARVLLLSILSELKVNRDSY
jgi:hypothetical protein